MNLVPADDDPDVVVEVFRSRGRASCDERAFVLHAVGIGSDVVPLPGAWSLRVLRESATAALTHLTRYDRENRARPWRRMTVDPAYPYAWLGPLAYVLVLVAIAYAAGRKSWATDWLDAGVLDTAAVRRGELWRAVTALTLHFDVAHLLGNLGFGAFFGGLAAQLVGPGIAFGAAALAATAANLVDASFQPAEHVSAGASTMVFSLLGLLAAYAWRRRAETGERWAYRWAPLLAGVFLLAFTGAGGDRTDVLAHLSGFVMGVLAGASLALRSQVPGPRGQWSAGLTTLAAIAVAWACAIAG